MKWSYSSNKFRWGISLFSKKLDGEEITGFTNRCVDGKYVVFLEYDGMPLEWIKEEVEYLLEYHKLGNSYIAQSSMGDNYHFICPDKITLEEYVAIMQMSSSDKRHQMIPLRTGRKAWVLRTSEKKGFKPKIVETIISKHNGIPNKSSPHMRWMEKNYKIKIRDALEDGKRKLITARYTI